MLETHILMTFNAIRRFPGEDLEGLQRRIHDLYGEQIAAYYLYCQTGDLLLQSRIRELDCVREENGRYYFDPATPSYSSNALLDTLLRGVLENEKKQRQQYLRRPRQE